eukprot:TRINITY_DN7123_c0_g5_i1.p1 TRINITY_DN7123_c0_g5~~TRINITY_DN7123_c0_g5_i1.p1  ORF type:complete len:245 (+),score=35.67 TRINITY_DN7123_c0_g5_i1:605-1339(+)
MAGVSVGAFGCAERAMKEEWVLFDSFKKSSMIFMGLFDSLPYFAFIIDSSGRILYKNSAGVEMLENYNEAEGKGRTGNFTEMIHPECRKSFQREIKSAYKSPECKSIEVPIKTHKSNEQASNNDNSSLILEYQALRSEGSFALKHNIGYDMYILKLKKHYWKSQNVILVLGMKITQRKTREEMLLQHQMQTCKMAEDLWSNIRLLGRHGRGKADGCTCTKTVRRTVCRVMQSLPLHFPLRPSSL